VPVKSRAQLRKFIELLEQGKISQEKYNEMTADIPNNLPERVGKPGRKKTVKSVVQKRSQNKIEAQAWHLIHKR